MTVCTLQNLQSFPKAQSSTQNAIAKPFASERQWKPYQKEGDGGNLRDSQSTCATDTYGHNILQDQQYIY